MPDPDYGGFSPTAFLKAWNDYIAASQAISEQPGAAPLPIFGAWADFAKSLGMQFDLNDPLAHVAPALGWGREYQVIMQRLQEIGAQFQRRYTEFLKLGAEVSEQALRSAQRRVAADPQLASSPADAYEAWIDSAETAYAQAAHSETFSRSLGELCNLLSSFKIERGKLLDSLARHLDLPSRAEVDSLHRQVRDLSAAVRAPKPRAARKPAKT